MTDEQVGPVGEEPTGPTGSTEATGPTGPTSGEPDHGRRETAGRSGQGRHGGDASAEPGGEDEYDVFIPDTPGSLVDDEIEGEVVHEAAAGDVHPDTRKAAEHLEDLRRLQAEYVNYKKRVDRDRDVIRNTAVGSVVESLLPVLDDIHMARQAGDLADGPFASIADKLESILGRYGVERLGEAGQEFDPNVHEALMHVEAELPEGASGTQVVQVLQPGYRIGERLVRAARVSVADAG